MTARNLVYQQLIVTADRRINARDEPAETLQAMQDDIAEHGIRTPILVCHHVMHHLFEVMAGFRRVECIRRLNEGRMIPRIRHIPAEVLTPEEWTARTPTTTRYSPTTTVEGSESFLSFAFGQQCEDCGERPINGQPSHMPECPRAKS